MVITKEFEAKALTPMGESDALALINKLAPYPVESSQVYLGKARLANTETDRAFERFPVSYLERFAQTLPGKPVLEGHDKTKSPSGRWFDATVSRDERGVTHLVADYYTLAGSELSHKIQTGIARDVSIGFQAAGRTCDLCSAPYDGAKGCDHQAGQQYDGKLATVSYSGDTNRVEAMEGSFVWVGCQRGATAIGTKAFWPGGGILQVEYATGTEGMKLTPAVATGAPMIVGGFVHPPVQHQGEQMEKAELEAQVKALTTENEELLAKAAALAANGQFALDGKQYHDDLIGEIGRKLGVLERPAELPLALLENANLVQLKKFDSDLGVEINKRFPPSPQSKMVGEPNGAVLIPPGEMPPPRLRTSVFGQWGEE